MASLEDMTPEMRDELALLALKLSENKETRPAFLRMTAKATGNHIPEIAIEDHTNEALEAANKRVDQMEAQLRDREAKDELEKRRRDLIAKGKVKGEDDIAEVEKIMLEKGITNHETAAEFLAQQRQAAPVTPSVYNANVMDEKARSALSAFWKNPQMAARNEASAALTELRKNPRPVGL